MDALGIGITSIVVIILISLLIGSTIFAWLHGIGFSVFKLKDIKPKFKTRFIIQIVTLAVSFVVGYVIGADGMFLVFATGQGHPGFFLFVIGLFWIVLMHGTIAVVTYAMVTNPNWRPALLSPSICSGLVLVMFLGVTILVVSAT